VGISIYFSAKRPGVPPTPEETALVRGVFKRANENWPPEREALFEVPGMGRFLLYDLERPLHRGQGKLLDGCAELPLGGRFDALGELLSHWCATFTEVRRQLDAPTWSAHLDDHSLAWNEASKQYALPATADAAWYRAAVAFVRGGR